jgi:hypothetical protein
MNHFKTENWDQVIQRVYNRCDQILKSNWAQESFFWYLIRKMPEQDIKLLLARTLTRVNNYSLAKEESDLDLSDQVLSDLLEYCDRNGLNSLVSNHLIESSKLEKGNIFGLQRELQTISSFLKKEIADDDNSD